MDLVVSLPRTLKRYDTWIVVDRLTKTTHLTPVKVTYSEECLAEFDYIKPFQLSIPMIFLLYFSLLRMCLKALGTQLKFSITFHPQTDSQLERTIQTLEDILRTRVLDFGRSWDKKLLLIEFSYNNSHQVSLSMALYKTQYGRKYWSPVQWYETRYASLDQIDFTRERMKTI